MVDLSRRPIGVIQAINHRDSIGFGESHQSLIQLLADQAGVAIQRYRLQESALEATSLRREMELASEVQQALIPKEPPRFAGFDVTGWTKPASTTGGDCFDLWKTHDGRLGVFVGDASGHGLGPALVVSQTRTVVRAMCDQIPDPHELLACANARLSEDLQLGQFVTAFLGFISSDGELTWSAAGHGPILVRRSADAEIHKLQPPAPPLGVVPDYMGRRTKKLKIGPGGMLAVFSDGVTEAWDSTGVMYDVSRLVERLSSLRDEPVSRQLASIQSELRRWQGGDVPNDDQTVVIAKKV
jgi:serine phosphatase RsbU (regulator of sigma subunit)